MAENKTKYKYVKLNTLKPSSKADVYGVVKFFKPPYKTRGSDHCMMVSIIDESFTNPMDKLKCILFNRESDNLPSCKVGQILRFHRLSISEFNGSLQAQNGPGFSWVLFSGEVNSSLDPIKTSSTKYSIEESDGDRVKELRDWASKIDELKEKLNCFQDVAPGCYFDILCQVVYTSVIEDGVFRLLKVWDGTNTVFQCRKPEFDSQEEDIQKDDKLMKIAEGFVYNVMVYDDHFKPSGCIKPGGFVKITNLHASEHNDGNDQSTVEFDLHRGTAFGRGVRVVNAADPDLAELKTRLEMITEQYGNTESEDEEKNKEQDSANTQDVVNILNSLERNSQDLSTEKTSVRDENPVPSTSGVNERPSYSIKGKFKGQGQSTSNFIKCHSTSKVTQGQSPSKVTKGQSTSKVIQVQSPSKVIQVQSPSKVTQGQSTSMVIQVQSPSKVTLQGQSTSKGKQVQCSSDKSQSQGPSTSKVIQNHNVPQDIMGHNISEVTKGHGVSEVTAVQGVSESTQSQAVLGVSEGQGVSGITESQVVSEVAQYGSDISNSVQSNVGTSANCTSEESDLLVFNNTYNNGYNTRGNKRKKTNSDQSQNVPGSSRKVKKLFKTSKDKSQASEEEKIGESQMDIDALKELVINDECHQISLDAAQKVQDKDNVSSSLRCMVETNTVVLNHPMLERTKIKEILNKKVPDIFRIRARVYEYHPKFTNATNFLQLYCSTCEYLSPHPDSKSNKRLKLQKGSTFNGVPHYNCPRCYENKDSLEGLDSPPHLKYIYMMRFVLYDGTEMLLVNVWREEAELLFQNIEPESLLKDKKSVELLKEQLFKICPINVNLKDRPQIECCVKSYTACGRTNFQMFDTCVV